MISTSGPAGRPGSPASTEGASRTVINRPDAGCRGHQGWTVWPQHIIASCGHYSPADRRVESGCQALLRRRLFRHGHVRLSLVIPKIIEKVRSPAPSRAGPHQQASAMLDPLTTRRAGAPGQSRRSWTTATDFIVETVAAAQSTDMTNSAKNHFIGGWNWACQNQSQDRRSCCSHQGPQSPPSHLDQLIHLPHASRLGGPFVSMQLHHP